MVDPLLARFDDRDENVRFAVAGVFRTTTDPRIIARLIAFSESANPNAARHADPALQHLFDALLGYRDIAAAPRRQVASAIDVGTPRGRLLAGTGVATTPVGDVLVALRSGKEQLVVFDATAAELAALASDVAAVQRFTANGGWLIAWGVAPDGLASFNRIVGVEHLIRPFRRERVVFPSVRDPLVAGLTISDLAISPSASAAEPTSPRHLEEETFTHVLDHDDIAPFCTYPPWQRFNPGAAQPAPDRDPYNLVNGLTTRDGWRHIFQLSTEPAFLEWDIELPRAETLERIEIINNGLYRFLTRIELSVDGDAARMVPLSLAPVAEVVQTFPLPGERATRVHLKLATWTDGETAPVVGIDHWRIRVRRSQEFHDRVKPLLNIGTLIRYPQGNGGVLLCNLRVPDIETAADAKRLRLVGTLLRNLGAEFAPVSERRR